MICPHVPLGRMVTFSIDCLVPERMLDTYLRGRKLWLSRREGEDRRN